MNSNVIIVLVLFVIFQFCPTNVSSNQSNIETIECGRATRSQLRIVGGNQAERNAWPWMVSIFTGEANNQRNRTIRQPHSCGGVLISRNLVLTAAHCLDYKNRSNFFPFPTPSSWTVTVGMHNRNLNSSDRERWQIRGIRHFFVHPYFQDLMSTAFHDIAVVQLNESVEFTEHVKPICLPRRRITEPGNICYVAGWGTTAETSDVFSLTLQDVGIPMVSSSACSLRYKTLYDPNQHLCGGDWFHGNKDSCKGDSGGPLACQLDNGSWYVAGIVSWGMGCGRPETPGIYTNVRSYEDWIREILVAISQESRTLLDINRVRMTRSVEHDAASLLKRLMVRQ